MANNPYVNKVVFGNMTLIDTSNVTVTPDKLAEGYTALDASGALITGTASGGGGVLVNVPPNDVTFYDYDGTIVYSYTASQFLNLDSLPANPNHTAEGLTAEGWSYNLVDAQDYVEVYGRLNIGQMYSTTDYKTHIHIRLEQGRTSPSLTLVYCDIPIEVDWGDGSLPDILDTGEFGETVSTPIHYYASPGLYTIKIGGGFRFGSSLWISRSYKYAITSINMDNNYGTGYEAIESSVFEDLINLKSITLPNIIALIGEYAFMNTKSLQGITLPRHIYEIQQSAFYGSGIKSICLSLGPEYGESVFSGSNIFSFSFPPIGIDTIPTGMFDGCKNLTSITIPEYVYECGENIFGSDTPNGRNYSLAEIHFKGEYPPVMINSYWYSAIPSDCIIYVPTGCLENYIYETNYPDPSYITYVEE